MRKINLGGCGCRDCNADRMPDRGWLKRFWKKDSGISLTEDDLMRYYGVYSQEDIDRID